MRIAARLLVASATLFLGAEVSFAQTDSSDQSTESDNKQQMDAVVVESTPLGQTLFESAQPVSVLDGDDLTVQSHSTLGETLANEPGVSSTSFGPGASRPVIRGLGGDRIRILEQGLGTQDVSNTSPDHGVTIDPALVDKIEVVRGPAALLYGTGAVGGVVNALDNRVPETLPKGPATGEAEIRGGTVDSERAVIGKAEAPLGPVAVHLDGILRNTDDYHIPGFARTEDERNSGEELEFPEPKGKVPFSDTKVRSGATGASYVFDRGFLGTAGSVYDTSYGVPNGENDVSIHLHQWKIDTRGELSDPLPGIEKVRLNAGYVDYKHTEYEGPEKGTVFTNEGVDSRLEFYHDPLGPLKGLFGFQFLTSDFAAIGEEAFQPPTDSDVYSAFVFEELPLNDTVKLQGGVRYDYSDYSTSTFPAGESAESEEARTAAAFAKSVDVENLGRDFSTVSGSTGVVWTPTEMYSYALSLSYTERAPATQELFANGPHVATAAFEVGDPGLDIERSFGVDLTARKRNGRVTGSIGGFMNQFYDFISLDPSGEEEDGLPVYDFVAEEAQFFGLESQVRYHLLGEVNEDAPAGEDLALLVQPDWVWAENRDTGEPIPRIPAFRLRTGIEYSREELAARLDYTRVFEQGRNAEFETETDGYNLVNASVLYALNDFISGPIKVSLFARGENLLNEKARNSVSFIKDITPLPGANLVGGVKVTF